MTDENDRIDQLLHKLDILIKQQEYFSDEISTLKLEIDQIRKSPSGFEIVTSKMEEPPVQEARKVPQASIEDIKTMQRDYREKMKKQPSTSIPGVSAFNIKSDLEKFIGENLISKIGIAILVIGVAIGAKYTIEHDLISPLTRIILGYFAGLGLLGFGIKLKEKYQNYSAVLVSGAMAVMYFITFAAYNYYALIPQVFAFGLMVIFTAFTVLAALKYDNQVIAHIGLVGSYAVPFLLSDGSGKVAVLFTYMAIINIGILAIAIKKYWKVLNYISFGLTWFIFLGWYIFSFNFQDHFTLAFVFSIIFFLTFYASFLSYKLIYKETFLKGDVVLILSNAFIFFGIGYSLLDDHPSGQELLGLFTLANAIVHFVIATIIYKQKLGDKNLFYLIAGLVLVFITIAIPVQLDGNWVTLLWAGEAALLFWIGRSKQIVFYERLSYALMLVATLSLFQDWSMVYNRFSFDNTQRFTPLFNIHFLTSLVFIAAFSFITGFQQNKKYPAPYPGKMNVFTLMVDIIPVVLLLAIYLAFRFEIAHYWDQLYAASALRTGEPDHTVYLAGENHDYMRFKQVWIINYSLFFLAVLSFVNIFKLKNKRLGNINLALNVLAVFVFLTLGLFTFGELRESYIHPVEGQPVMGGINITIRYISFAFLVLILYAIYRYISEMYPEKLFRKGFDILAHFSILSVTSSEMINLLDLSGSDQTYKLGLSILWGAYALLLIILGIWKNKKHLRLAAIILFGVTLLKLFLYDISQLNTMAKTIVFISLGILLLVISFLYNKYKNIISNDVEV